MLPYLTILAAFEGEAKDNFHLSSILHKFEDLSPYIDERMASKGGGHCQWKRVRENVITSCRCACISNLEWVYIKLHVQRNLGSKNTRHGPYGLKVGPK